jgi:hypothetical protein
VGLRTTVGVHIAVIFDRHAKLPMASGSVPLMTGVPQSL